MSSFSFFSAGREKNMPAMSVNKTAVGFSAMQFHDDIKDLLWYADSPLKNIKAGESIRTHSYEVIARIVIKE